MYEMEPGGVGTKFNTLGGLQLSGQVENNNQIASTSNQQKGLPLLPDSLVNNLPNSKLDMGALGIGSLYALLKNKSDSVSMRGGVGSDLTALNQQRTRPIGPQPTSSANTKPPYVDMLNKQSKSSEFQIHSEDFPALPGAAAMNVMKAVFPDPDGRGDESSDKFNPLGSLHLGSQISIDKTNPNSTSGHQKGIQLLPDNTLKNIPNSMITDQFGIAGVYAFIKAADKDPSLVHLALGNDLTTLGLNLNSPENLYHKFQSPFSRQPCRLQDIDFFVPSEYLTNAHIRDKLAPIKLNRYGEDLLFYVYYTNPSDVLQLAAAAELYNREWRYHKQKRIWITRAPGIEPRMKTSTYEQGTYYYLDCHEWRKVAKEFHVEYDKLEERPHLPNLMSLHLPVNHNFD